MSGNGGPSPSLLAATTGEPPPDRGRKLVGNPMEDMEEEEFQEEESQSQSTNEFQGSEDSWGGTFNDNDKEEGNGGFAAGVRAVFPMGISNATSKKQDTQTTNLVTPQVHRQTTVTNSSRGGRGGANQRSSTYLAIKAGVTTIGGNVDQLARSARTTENIEEVEFIETRKHQPMLQPVGFRKASKMLQEEEKILKMLPEQIQPELCSTKTYNYVAELQFNWPLSEKGAKMDNSKEFNILNCLGQWIKRTREISPEFMLHPYKIESGGNPITNENQIPRDDGEAVGQYFYNHRIESSGILKGMIRFTTTVPWVSMKDQRLPYFKWLYNNRVYLRHTSFDAETVVLLGYLQGAHPDAARLTDLTKELKERLKLREGIDFQLSPRNLTVQDSSATKTKYNFRAIAVETDGKMAAELRENFFRLGDPKIEKHSWPISGNYLFVPMFRTTSWPTENIAAMAKLHSRSISVLEQIFVENIFDIDKKMVFKEPGGTETTRSIREAIQSLTNQTGDENVVHSAHNTNRSGVIQILVHTKNTTHAKAFFSHLQDQLRAALSPEDLHELTKGNTIQVTSRTYESSDSKKYASYAEALLRENPQNGEETEVTSPQRKKTRMEVSYSSVAKRSHEATTRQKKSELAVAAEKNDDDTDSEWEEYGDSFWERKVEAGFNKLFGDQLPLRADEMESKMRELIDRQATEAERRLDQKFANIATELKNITEKENNKSKRMICTLFEKQNQVLYSLTTSLQNSLLLMHENMLDIADATRVKLTHQAPPRIDIPQMSSASRSDENGARTGGEAT